MRSLIITALSLSAVYFFLVPSIESVTEAQTQWQQQIEDRVQSYDQLAR